jgi:CRISPR system Cascade subunit CasE
MISTSTDSAFLAKIIANPAQRTVRQDLSDIHRMHQMVTRLTCPPDFGPASRSAAGVLYRVEETAVGVYLLVQSRTMINVEDLPAGYAPGGVRELDALLERLTAGTRVRYRILANPTKQEHNPGRRGTLRPLTGDEALAWWERKAADAGLALDAATITDTTVLRGTRRGNADDCKVTLTTSRFEGLATVRDADALRIAIFTGVGRGRAYGCGLLSVAPVA